MKEIGDWLRREREARGLSREAVEQLTKICPRYLAALEEGRFEVLPGSAYVLAFIRTYAVGIGADPGPIIGQYKEYERRQEAELQKLLQPRPVSTPRRLARGVLARLNGTMEWLGL